MKLHLGCGAITLPGWVNVDLDAPTADMRLDLTQPLPFEDGTVTHIFTEHFLEHLTREEAVRFLKECLRVLSDEGVLRVSTPDLAFLVAMYVSKNTGEWGNLWQPDSPCLLMNEGMHSWGHKFLYDADEITRVLTEAGFSQLNFMDWQESGSPELRGLESRPYHNDLIVEVQKTNRQSPAATSTLPAPNSSSYEDRLGQLAGFIRIINTQAKSLQKLSGSMGEQTAAQNKLQAALDGVCAKFDMLTGHVAQFESSIRNQQNQCSWLQQEIVSRDGYIRQLEARIESQASRHEQEIRWREQIEENQKTHNANLEAELARFRGSWYGKLLLFRNVLRRP